MILVGYRITANIDIRDYENHYYSVDINLGDRLDFFFTLPMVVVFARCQYSVPRYVKYLVLKTLSCFPNYVLIPCLTSEKKHCSLALPLLKSLKTHSNPNFNSLPGCGYGRKTHMYCNWVEYPISN